MGSGFIYVASIDVLQACVPETPALVAGLGTLINSAEDLFRTSLYTRLTRWMGDAEPTMIAVGLLVGTGSLVATTCTRRSPRGWKENGGIKERDSVKPPLSEKQERRLLLPPSVPRAKPLAVRPVLSAKQVLRESVLCD